MRLIFLQDLVKIIAMGKVFFRHKIEVLNYSLIYKYMYSMISKVYCCHRKKKPNAKLSLIIYTKLRYRPIAIQCFISLNFLVTFLRSCQTLRESNIVSVLNTGLLHYLTSRIFKLARISF